jgi:hypothetical protein
MRKRSNIEEISAGEPHGKLAHPVKGRTFSSSPKYPD